MKNILKITILYMGLLWGQTAEQIKQAKEFIKKTGMSESQVKDAAKSRGYTDKQIDAAIERGKALRTKSETLLPENGDKIALPPRLSAGC